MSTKKEMLFRNLWNGSSFEYKGKLHRKISDAFSITLDGGKDVILLGKDRVLPIAGKPPVHFS